jgi:hypothetical protein
VGWLDGYWVRATSTIRERAVISLNILCQLGNFMDFQFETRRGDSRQA